MSEGRPTDGGQTSRRTLIKGAVVAGIGAWTAPVIIESVTSPAAALSPSGCSQVFQTVGSQGLFTPGAWGGWSDGSGSATDDGLPCPPGGCAPVNATSSSFRATIPVPTPGVFWGTSTTVTVGAPPGCRIVGLGVTLQPSDSLTGGIPPICATTTADIASTSVSRFTCSGIGTTIVTITPNGVGGALPTANRGVWDAITTSGDGRSSIVLQIKCP